MTDIQAPITEVTVYADRALITRQGSIDLEAGEHEICVNELPPLLRDSLRAAGKGPKGTRILNVDVTTAFYRRSPDQEIQVLQDEVEELEYQHDLLKTRQQSLGDRQKWLRSLGEQSKEFAKWLVQGQVKPEDCTNFFSFLSDQALQDAQAAHELEREIHKIQLDIQAKQRELNHKVGRAQPDRQAAVVSVEMAEAGTFTLELSYLVTSASWNPQYDVRVQINEQGNGGEVELWYVGLVQQHTGENWDHVELSLSTARPSLTAKIPDLKPWYINAYAPPPLPAPMMARKMAASAPMMSGFAPQAASASYPGEAYGSGMMDDTVGGDLKEEALPVEADIATTTIERTGTALVFRVGRSVDIPSDNSPHKTTIAHDNLPCDFDYVTAPAIEENAHLRATIRNTSERILLAGDANIFLAGEYVGTTQIKQTASSEEFQDLPGD